MADQQPTPYELLGGDAVVRALVDRFYALMDATPEYYGIRKLHPESLAGSADKLYMYLSGWLGGPNLYIDRYGHPRLRARHLPYAIASAERDQWMACMRQAMVDADVDARLREPLLEALLGVADWMRNRPDGGAG